MRLLHEVVQLDDGQQHRQHDHEHDAAHRDDQQRLQQRGQRERAALHLVAELAGSAIEHDGQLAGLLAQTGSTLLDVKAWADAEPILRESLAIGVKKQPDDWTTFHARSLLGGALLGQKKYADAEPLLLQGYEGMKQNVAKIPPLARVRPPGSAPSDTVQAYPAPVPPAAVSVTEYAALTVPPGKDVAVIINGVALEEVGDPPPPQP